MITFIYGSSSSGKSAYGEERIQGLNHENKYYLATMEAYDKESIKRIERHRLLRKDKGFETIECPRNIREIIPEIKEDSCLLLECLSNLLANEMFVDDKPGDYLLCANKIVEDILSLASRVEDLVIVSNNIFEDGLRYEKPTQDYMRALGLINSRICQDADEVYEVVVGIPVRIK
ncbi:MAG: bifunctional adenosylcobinamide kinase/adenosylcobinamide-phosphate guanylyltransferase [Pseudobutyrivibrio sp.]|nr:bifunctional adenosylcobinamide kinase/adenosylcobinamide-phosphate guanylyltransferase [Pseudobutyrivibrio sp.]